MNNYMVKCIKVYDGMTTEEHWKRVASAWPHYCKGLNEVWDYCGGRLHRGRCGYYGTIGDIEYVAVRV